MDFLPVDANDGRGSYAVFYERVFGCYKGGESNRSGSDSGIEVYHDPTLMESHMIYTRRLVVDFAKMHFHNNTGGEDPSLVFGQKETDEYPTAQHGAFQVLCDTTNADLRIPVRLVGFHKWMADHLEMIAPSAKATSLAASGVDRHVYGPVVMIQRIEYVNMYHTMAEWFSVFDSLCALSVLPGNNHVLALDVHIVWLDAHPHGSLDHAWEMLFRPHPVRYIHQYRELYDDNKNDESLHTGRGDTRVLFHQVMMANTGYRTALHAMVKNKPSGPIPTIQRFSMFLRRQLFGCCVPNKDSCDGSLCEFDGDNGDDDGDGALRVTFLVRRDYTPHARSNGITKRKIGNEAACIQVIRDALGDVDARLQVVSFETMSFHDQALVSMRTDVMISIHGAGLAHIYMMVPGTHLIEFMPTHKKNTHYYHGSIALGIEYHRVDARGVDPYQVDTQQLYNTLYSIVH